jgi:2-polyprenyl-3-methyl-5-hydroxy-6-metoxy-1,4-benzoquinol methylase
MGVGTATNADRCPVCAGPRGSVLYAEARDPITLSSFRVSECSVCRVAYTEPRPASLDRYYPQRYRGYGPLVTRILGAFYETRVSRWARLKPGGGSVLEIGCGPGLMLAAFAQRGWQVLGIERNEEAAERARRTPGLEITADPVEQLPANVRFDLIVMFHVLEHIGEPVALLRECAKHLVPDGRLIVNVPNFSSWQSRFTGSSWLHLDVPRHQVHFSPQTLAATFARANLKLTELRYASFEHDPYGWVESTLNRITSRPNTLTRFLMGIEPFGPAVVFSLLLGGILMPAALIVAFTSWAAGRGALMEATATLSAEKSS